MRFKGEVVSVNTLPNKLISLTLKNLDIPPNIEEIKEPDNLFDVQGMMKSAMAMQQKTMFRQMYESRIYSRLIITPDQFKELKVTVGNEVTFDVGEVKVDQR